MNSTIPHGGLDFEELAEQAIKPTDVIDFSSNVNPFGPSPRVTEMLSGIAVDRYPDRECTEVRHVLSEYLSVPAEMLLVGNGSSEILWLIGLAFLRPGDRVLIARPTYGEYERVTKLMGAQVIFCSAAEDLQISSQGISQNLEETAPRACFLCRPNNPTGCLIAASTVEQWANRFPHILFVVDEAYMDFLPAAASLIQSRLKNVLVLRSLGKAHALAGLRVGYVVASAERIEALRNVRPPWSVNTAAQLAAVAALQDKEHLQGSLERLALAKHELTAQLGNSRWHVVTSLTPFFLVKVGYAQKVRLRLLEEHRLLVRDCTSFGLPQYIRVSTRDVQDNARLVEALGVSNDCERQPTQRR